MAITSTIWPMEPHTAAKHVILRKYLDAWLPKITRYNNKVIICDGFAGPGVYQGGEHGSPVVALNAYLEHPYRPNISARIIYLFVEAKKKRHTYLEQVIAPYRDEVPESVKIQTQHSDCDTAIQKIVNYIDDKNEKVPIFAFIDPFGIKGVSLSTITHLMAHDKCEVFITFMMSSLQRFLEKSELQAHCDDFFGCTDWRAALPMEGQERETYLRKLYQRRLKDADGVAANYVRFFTMRNRENTTIYDLFFATNHKQGIDAMKDAMWKVDPGGHFTFSDATNPDQNVLFSPEPDWEVLIDHLVNQFGGTSQPWPVVEEAVRNTAFQIRRNPLKKNARLKIVNPPGTNAVTNCTQIQFS